MKTMFALLALAGLGAVTVVSAQQAMNPHMAGMEHASQPADAQGVGVIKAIDTAKGTITLQHEAIPAIGWPAMTMAFKVASPALLTAGKVGDRVRFGVKPAGMASTVTSIAPVN
jgi:Cu(I)/Ag(I) efflux system protein CusF